MPDKITIDLASMYGEFKLDKIVRRDAFKRVIEKLYRRPEDDENLERRSGYRPSSLNVMKSRRHETIMISARRGDGKTTFLTDILRFIEKRQAGDAPNELFEYIEMEGGPASLYSLGIVDPTLIETKQNIVVMIIEKIKAAVDQAKRADRPAAEDQYREFKQRLRELAAGLTLLDGIGDESLHGKEWVDPDYVLDKGLDRASAAAAFERSFYRYVGEACRFLTVDAFVLAVDDVDTSFERGWPVLEAIRKYLATPRLKLLLAGDMKLYNLLVRQQQWKQMTSDFINAERQVPRNQSYSDQIAPMIDVLQDQYLVKIVRPENRIDLQPLTYYAERASISFTIGNTKAVTERMVSRRYAKLLLGLGAPEDVATIQSIMLRLPMRSSLQLYSSVWPLLSNGSRDDQSQQYEIALDTLRHVASTGLMVLDFDENELRNPDPDRIFGVFAGWMTKKDLWRTMARFYPEGLEESSDLAAMSVGATLVDLFRRQPRAMIDYWLKVCTIREKIDRGDITTPERLKELLDHLNIRSKEEALQTVSRLAAWEAAEGQQIARGIRISGAAVPAGPRVRETGAASSELYGDFDFESFRRELGAKSENSINHALQKLPAPLRGFHLRLARSGWDYSYSGKGEAGFVPVFGNTLESLRAGLSGQVASIAMIPASRITSGQQSDNGSYSLLRILGFISGTLGVSRGSLTARALRRRLDQFLVTSGMPRSYPTPGGAATSTAGSNLDEDSEIPANLAGEREELGADYGTSNDEAVNALIKWLDALNANTLSLAPITLARVWTRFSYAFDSIRDELRHAKTRYLGVLMHRSIIAFLHALAVETYRAEGNTIGPKVADNPVRSSEPFLAMLQELDIREVHANTNKDEDDDSDDDEEVRFFRWIFACPLWGYFLARHEEDLTGSKGRDAAGEIFDLYRQQSRAFTGLELDYSVSFRQPNDGRTAQFDGLFFLLNSVYLQGHKAARTAEPKPATRRPVVRSRLNPSGGGNADKS
ncbi:hypothetical protein [Rhizobium leguminosarum]|uniref:Uncharacterized protein n=1 Tax=Rhizobium leguminosarum TaxID=384 RepID=A0A2K9ZG42_RHILE|nr:hypothetical protein [Rhizobium leguminosarum]AUW47204.1 hypothetical protein CUJ84_pRLN3000066 [Rhizobium leguminosarum]